MFKTGDRVTIRDCWTGTAMTDEDAAGMVWVKHDDQRCWGKVYSVGETEHISQRYLRDNLVAGNWACTVALHGPGGAN